MKENKKEQEQKTVIEMAELKFGKEKLAELKAQFPGRKLNIIVVEDKVAILMPVTAKAISDYTRLFTDPEAGLDVASKCIMNELWLIGDEELRDDEEYFTTAMIQVQNVVELKKSAFGRF